MVINKIKTFIIFSLLLVMVLPGCNKSSNADIKSNTDASIYSVDDFTADLKEKNKNIKIEDVDDSLLKGDRRSITYGKEFINVYVYKNNEEMEADSQNIDKDGSEYKDENNHIFVDWVSAPHFYKKGTIIVCYAGEDKKIISYLKEIMGEQFAGYK